MKPVYFYSKPDLAYGTDLQSGLSAQLREWEWESSALMLWAGGRRNSIGWFAAEQKYDGMPSLPSPPLNFLHAFGKRIAVK